MKQRVLLAVLVALALPTGPAMAQTPLPAPQPAAVQEQIQPDPVPARSQPAQQTREELNELLREAPPSVRSAIRLDPSLMGNADYMAPYPRLAAFLAQHPEISRDPTFFFGPSGFVLREQTPASAFASMFEAAAATIGVVTFFIVVGSVLRQFVNYRRWLRRSRMQTEVHTKILDRLQSNEDLLAYVQTPAGRHFLEFGSPVAESEPTPPGVAPYNRILWSVQAGVVLTALGLGLWLAQGRVPDEVAGPLGVLAVVVTAGGIGAVVSAGAAYLLSVRLGVVPQSKPSSGSPDA